MRRGYAKGPESTRDFGQVHMQVADRSIQHGTAMGRHAPTRLDSATVLCKLAVALLQPSNQ
jgi:hypothetical protein